MAGASRHFGGRAIDRGRSLFGVVASGVAANATPHARHLLSVTGTHISMFAELQRMRLFAIIKSVPRAFGIEAFSRLAIPQQSA